MVKRFPCKDRPDCRNFKSIFQSFKEHIHMSWLGISFLCSYTGRQLHSGRMCTL